MGRELGLSRERVRQIEVQAMQQVRAALASRSELHGTGAPELLRAS
jgi:DNA-directed RNA polymerase sigma subunit (sigma70/sigma32)